MCGVFVLAARSTSTTLKITHLPSGETCGSPTRFSFIISSKVKGCLDWAASDDAIAMSARLRMRRRRMRRLLKSIRGDVTGYAGSIGAVGKDVASNVSTANG
jgi:hypothetical protein